MVRRPLAHVVKCRPKEKGKQTIMNRGRRNASTQLQLTDVELIALRIRREAEDETPSQVWLLLYI